MLVKRYVVKEMPEAVAMIREDLGKDAVILSTKKIQSRGFLGLFAKTQIEVVAAANEQEPVPKQQKQSEQPEKLERLPVQGVPRTAAMDAYQLSKAQPQQQIAAIDRDEVFVPPVLQRTEEPSVQPEPVVVPFTPPVVTRQPDPVPEPQPDPVLEPQSVKTPAAAPDGELLQEVQELRQLLRTIVQAPERGMLPDAVLAVRKQLLGQEIEEKSVDELIERGILQTNEVQSVNEQEFRAILTNFIKEELERVAKPSPLSQKTRVASLMGPTGVGKTTTIAKLAAEQVLKHGKKVGLITTDTYRIAAVEQLRTYANILNVPLEVCYSPDDITRSLERFADRDLILVDTAGRNYGNLLNVRELNAYLQALLPDETFLVLSLTTKASDLEEIVGNFTQVRTDKFLFTKSDETKTYGAIYNLVTRYGIPLSYLTYGQNVPDDIETLSTDKLASLLVERSPMYDQAQRLRHMVAKHSQSPVGETRIIAITSGKGGVGKSNFTLNYALGLSESGSKVVVIDGDIGFANIDVLMNVKPTKTLADLMRGDATIWEVLEKGPQNVEFIAGGSGLQDLLHMEMERFNYVLEQFEALQGYADYVLIDTGAGLDEHTLRLLLASDEIYVVLTPEPTSITDAYALIKMVTNRDSSVPIQLVVNRAQSTAEGQEAANKISLVAQRFLNLSLSTICILPDDPNVAEAVKRQVPFLLAHPMSEAARSLKSMIQAQKNGVVPAQRSRGMKQFLHRMVRLFR